MFAFGYGEKMKEKLKKILVGIADALADDEETISSVIKRPQEDASERRARIIIDGPERLIYPLFDCLFPTSTGSVVETKKAFELLEQMKSLLPKKAKKKSNRKRGK